MNTYILNGKTPVKTDTSMWWRWFEANGETRRVGHTEIGGATVSTVFLLVLTISLTQAAHRCFLRR